MELDMEPIILKQANPRIEIRLESKSVNTSFRGDDSVALTIKNVPRIYVDYNKKKDIKNVIDDIECLMQFFGLLIGTVSTVDDIRLSIEGQDLKSWLYINRDFSYNLRTQDIFDKPRTYYYVLSEYLLKMYPQIQEDYKDFCNIVIKKFDWENYIYKAILIAQYVEECAAPEKQEQYYHLILQNMDVFNYIIKYEIFRNGRFLINIMDIIEETGLSKVLKAKIRNRPDLGKDERYGRRVIFEFNKAYPVVMSPMLEKEELKEYFLEYLGYYYKGTLVELDEDDDGEF